jgi:hypothetical protein
LVDGCNVIVLLGISANWTNSEDSGGSEEKMLWDVQDQKLYDFTLVGFVVSEIKSRIPA